MAGRKKARGAAGPVRSVASCVPCDKQSYRNRAAAKKAARVLYPGEHLSPYMCPHGAGFHIGHLGRQIIAGKSDRETVYGGRQEPTA